MRNLARQIFSITVLMLVVTINALASETGSVEMADALRKDGKIYVVVLVLLTIVIGLFLFLLRMEKRVKKVEENLNQS